jgi:hypothetical protein
MAGISSEVSVPGPAIFPFFLGKPPSAKETIPPLAKLATSLIGVGLSNPSNACICSYFIIFIRGPPLPVLI